MATSRKFIPGSEVPSEEIFTYPFLVENDSKEFIKDHGKIMFIIRGPPGTGKWSLTKLLTSHFPAGIKCSADDYFTTTFNHPDRNKESLKQSHFHCHAKVKKECMKNSHPLIVSNTHMRKFEMEVYLKLAREYGYTVVITSTLDKFEVSPKILAKSNTKGLSENYFKKRLQAWEDVFPEFMGWFLCPDDSSYLIQQLKCALESLLSDGRFCRTFDVFDMDALLNNYKAKNLLYCMAAFMENNSLKFRDYYKSDKVCDSYGRCFTISIPIFVVTKSNIFAMVLLDSSLKKLVFKPVFESRVYTNDVAYEDDIDDIVNTMQNVSLHASYNFQLTPLTSEFSKQPKTAVCKERHDNLLNVRNCSFIHLAQKEEKTCSVSELHHLFLDCFTNVNEMLSQDQFRSAEDGYAIYRLNNDGWMIWMPKTLSFKTVFSGFYV